jgi:hypothetical protein
MVGLSWVGVDSGGAMSARRGLAAFVERRGDRSAEVVWSAALAMLERACADARECSSSRWRWYPAGELRRLRRDVAEGLELARLAVALQEEDAEQRRELDRDLAAAAAEAGRARRRAQTLPAERARLANAEARKTAGNSSRNSGSVGR